jgi:predicted ester cyclase
MFRTGFPDIKVTVEDLVAEGEKVVARWTWRGTNQGEFQGMSPTGKQVTGSGISIHRFANGKFAEAWVNFDTLGMLQQLGVIPAMG